MAGNPLEWCLRTTRKGAAVMRHYKHLTIEEREKLYLMKNLGYSKRKIAQELGRSPSTISRELKRGRCGWRPYSPSTAQIRYEKRRKKCGKKHKLSIPKYRETVRKLIEEQHWSPEQIANRLKLENNPLQISYASIYRAINAGLFNGPLNKEGHLRKASRFSRHLRHKGKTRKAGGKGRQSQIPITHLIEERPQGAQDRTEIGHFEGDTVIGKRGSACLLTLVDRKTRYTVGGKTASKEAEAVKEKMIEALSRLPQDKVKSVTPDRGREFARHQEVTKALPQVEFYFPAPYSPWERGTNENTNGLIREFLPKGYDMANASDKQIEQMLFLLNTRPRKCLNWLTPMEALFDYVLHLT